MCALYYDIIYLGKESTHNVSAMTYPFAEKLSRNLSRNSFEKVPVQNQLKIQFKIS